jgi:hypothetical protein
LSKKPNSYIYKLLYLTTNPNTKDVYRAYWVFAYHKESSHKASRNITFGSHKYLLSFAGTLSQVGFEKVGRVGSGRRLDEWVPGKSNCKSTSAASNNQFGLNAGTSFGGRLNGARRNERDLG